MQKLKNGEYFHRTDEICQFPGFYISYGLRGGKIQPKKENDGCTLEQNRLTV